MPARRRPSLVAAAAAAIALAVLVAAAAPTAARAASAPAHRRVLSSRSQHRSHHRLGGSGDCICLFDVDRTISAIQGASATTCAGDEVFSKISDSAYKPKGKSGPFTASEFALNIRDTWCGQNCRLGVISAGVMNTTTGPVDPEHLKIAELLSKNNGNAKMPTPDKLPWAKFGSSTLAPFIWDAPATSKYQAVPTILRYYAQFGANIANDQVFFFDDIAENVKPWRQNSPYNAHQIACDKRAADPTGRHPNEPIYLGLCGTTKTEINRLTFKKSCTLCGGVAC